MYHLDVEMFCSSYLLDDMSGFGLGQTGLFCLSSYCSIILAGNPTHGLTDMPTFQQSVGRKRYLGQKFLGMLRLLMDTSGTKLIPKIRQDIATSIM